MPNASTPVRKTGAERGVGSDMQIAQVNHLLISLLPHCRLAQIRELCKPDALKWRCWWIVLNLEYRPTVGSVGYPLPLIAAWKVLSWNLDRLDDRAGNDCTCNLMFSIESGMSMEYIKKVCKTPIDFVGVCCFDAFGKDRELFTAFLKNRSTLFFKSDLQSIILSKRSFAIIYWTIFSFCGQSNFIL